MNYVAKRNRHGQIVMVQAEHAHLPHVEVTWYDGGIGMGGHTAVQPGETDGQAARRAFGDRVQTRYADTFTWRREELRD